MHIKIAVKYTNEIKYEHIIYYNLKNCTLLHK